MKARGNTIDDQVRLVMPLGLECRLVIEPDWVGLLETFRYTGGVTVARYTYADPAQWPCSGYTRCDGNTLAEALAELDGEEP